MAAAAAAAAAAAPPPTYAEYVEATSMSCGIVPYYQADGQWFFGVTVRELSGGHKCLSLALGGRDLVFSDKAGQRWHFDLRSEHHVRTELMPFAKELGVPESVFAPFDESLVLTREERREQFYPAFVEALAAAGAKHIRAEGVVSAAMNECREELGLDASEALMVVTESLVGEPRLQVVRRDLASWRDGGIKRVQHVLYTLPITAEQAASHALNTEGAEVGAYLSGADIKKMVLEAAEHLLFQFAVASPNIDLFELANAIAAVQKYLFIICPIWQSLQGVTCEDLEAARFLVLLGGLLSLNARLEGAADKYAPVDMMGLVWENADRPLDTLTDDEIDGIYKLEWRRKQVIEQQ